LARAHVPRQKAGCIAIRSTDKAKSEGIYGSLVIQIRQRVDLNREGGTLTLIGGGMNQFEFDLVAASDAARKCLTLQKGDLMR